MARIVIEVTSDTYNTRELVERVGTQIPKIRDEYSPDVQYAIIQPPPKAPNIPAVKCPHCEAGIYCLILEGHIVNSIDAYGLWGKPDFDFDYCDEFECPECGAVVVKGENNAIEFLNGKKV